MSNLTDAGKQQVKDLSAWNVTAAGGTVEKVQGGDTVKFQAGDNLEVKQDGTTFTYSLAKDVKGLNSDNCRLMKMVHPLRLLLLVQL